MLGMTTSDAIALGSMVAALTAACVGLLRGDQARTARLEPPSTDEQLLGRLDALTEAMRDLVDILRAAVAIGSSKQQLTETIGELLHRNDRHQG